MKEIVLGAKSAKMNSKLPNGNILILQLGNHQKR